MATTGIIDKHPDDISRIEIDWTDWLLAQPGIAISASVWENATPGGGDITLSGDALTDTNRRTSVLLTGGTDKGVEYIENEVAFSDGSLKTYTVRVNISDNIPA